LLQHPPSPSQGAAVVLSILLRHVDTKLPLKELADEIRQVSFRFRLVPNGNEEVEVGEDHLDEGTVQLAEGVFDLFGPFQFAGIFMQFMHQVAPMNT
jgi:hypothetical protein